MGQDFRPGYGIKLVMRHEHSATLRQYKKQWEKSLMGTSKQYSMLLSCHVRI